MVLYLVDYLLIIYHVVVLHTDQDKLEIDVEVNLTLADENDKKQKWNLVTDKKTGWMKIKKPNRFFLESSQNGNDLFIQDQRLTNHEKDFVLVSATNQRR